MVGSPTPYTMISPYSVLLTISPEIYTGVLNLKSSERVVNAVAVVNAFVTLAGVYTLLL